VTKGDSRVTRVGRFIRKTSIDELPQLFSVLRGELSLVGPRPHAVEAPTAKRLWEEVVDSYFARHRVRPGLTGWAQINGWRGEARHAGKLQNRVEHDLYYIENWSLLFDLYILARTPFALLRPGERLLTALALHPAPAAARPGRTITRLQRGLMWLVGASGGIA
jgi:lipopolysaccharide/colanic/teichoic acid biosynthesis glycosyltransferase